MEHEKVKTPREVGKMIAAYFKENGISQKEAAERLEQLKQELMKESGITDPDPRDYDLAIEED